jgi:type II secretory ATPase GspE/PulE/Tfp pilus assembly ATPase PilB-like protein
MELDPFVRNIITVEDPVEFQMENITQIEINTKAGQSFASSLRSILRQDPDVILIGEMRDTETAVIACQAANTGHMVFSTVHANDTFAALGRLEDLGVEPFVLGDSISAVLAQRLLRRLCSSCKEEYKPNAESLREHRITPNKVTVFHRPPKNAIEVCANCGGLGYRGRTGVFELLVISNEMREMIRSRQPLPELKTAARRNHMKTMKEEGIRLVVKGTTSLAEVLRVVK